MPGKGDPHLVNKLGSREACDTARAGQFKIRGGIYAAAYFYFWDRES